MDTETSRLTDEAYRKLGNVLPAIAANEKAMRDFRRLLHKHKIEPMHVEPEGTAPLNTRPA